MQKVISLTGDIEDHIKVVSANPKYHGQKGPLSTNGYSIVSDQNLHLATRLQWRHVIKCGYQDSFLVSDYAMMVHHQSSIKKLSSESPESL